MVENEFDKYEQRCPRLGGPVGFNYCLQCEVNKKPCWKIRDCWWEYFDVDAYLQANLPEEIYSQLIEAKPKPKMVTLVEMIEAAKKRSTS